MIPNFIGILAFSLLFAAVAAAPISATNTTVDSETLLSNAQEAQQLNSQFQTLQLDDSCTGKQSLPLLNLIQSTTKMTKRHAYPMLLQNATTDSGKLPNAAPRPKNVSRCLH